VLTHRRTLADLRFGPLAGFKGGIARRVRRATATYARLLDESWHPRLGEDAETLRAHLAARLRTLAQDPIPSTAIQRAEAAQLIDGDVPYFTVRVGSKGAPGQIEGWEACALRTAALSPADKARQAWIARLSLQPLTQSLTRTVRPPATAAQIEAQARALGERLCALAYRAPGRVSWLSPAVDGPSG
jgi:hypothetical protein